jgi:hypothetical protein
MPILIWMFPLVVMSAWCEAMTRAQERDVDASRRDDRGSGPS